MVAKNMLKIAIYRKVSFLEQKWDIDEEFNIQHKQIPNIYELWHENSNNVVCATSKGSDQPAHMRRLIRAFASRFGILWALSYWPNIIWSF